MGRYGNEIINKVYNQQNVIGLSSLKMMLPSLVNKLMKKYVISSQKKEYKEKIKVNIKKAAFKSYMKMKDNQSRLAGVWLHSHI